MKKVLLTALAVLALASPLTAKAAGAPEWKRANYPQLDISDNTEYHFSKSDKAFLGLVDDTSNKKWTLLHKGSFCNSRLAKVEFYTYQQPGSDGRYHTVPEVAVVENCLSTAISAALNSMCSVADLSICSIYNPDRHLVQDRMSNFPNGKYWYNIDYTEDTTTRSDGWPDPNYITVKWYGFDVENGSVSHETLSRTYLSCYNSRSGYADSLGCVAAVDLDLSQTLGCKYVNGGGCTSLADMFGQEVCL